MIRSLPKFVAAVTGVTLLGFAVHDIVSLRMGFSSSVLGAPHQLWDAVGDVITWGIEYKVGATIVFVICLAILYVTKVPAIKDK